jgi:hypothetical protein
MKNEELKIKKYLITRRLHLMPGASFKLGC